MPFGKIEIPSMNEQLESGNTVILVKSSTVKTDVKTLFKAVGHSFLEPGSSVLL